MLRSGGSEAHPGPELDRILEELAAGIEGFALPEALLVGQYIIFQSSCFLTELASVTHMIGKKVACGHRIRAME